MSFFAKNDIVDVDIPGMNKKTILWTIFLIIIGSLTAYGTLYYLKWRDEQQWKKMREKEGAEISKKEVIPEEPITQEAITKQLKEIEELKQKENLQPPPTEKAITEQIKDLNTTDQQQDIAKPAQQQSESQQSQPTTLAPEEQQIQQQLEELNKINQQYK